MAGQDRLRQIYLDHMAQIVTAMYGIRRSRPTSSQD
jgi:hypothetical protein